MCEMGLTSLHDFEILRFVTYVHLPFSVGRLFCRFTRVYEGQFNLCYEEEFKVDGRAVRSCYGKF